MIITPTRRRHRSKHVPPWPLHPSTLWIVGTLLFLGALAWMVLIELPCGRDECGGLDGMKESRVFGAVWLAMAVMSAMYVRQYGSWLRMRGKAHDPGVFLKAVFASGAFAVLISVHLIAFANFTGPQRPVRFAGAIIDKREHRSTKSTSYDVTLRDVVSQRDVVIDLRWDVYRSARIGDAADCEYRAGRWGLIYRWERGEPRGCRFRRTAASAATAASPSRCRPVKGD